MLFVGVLVFGCDWLGLTFAYLYVCDWLSPRGSDGGMLVFDWLFLAVLGHRCRSDEPKRLPTTDEEHIYPEDTCGATSDVRLSLMQRHFKDVREMHKHSDGHILVTSQASILTALMHWQTWRNDCASSKSFQHIFSVVGIIVFSF